MGEERHFFSREAARFDSGEAYRTDSEAPTGRDEFVTPRWGFRFLADRATQPFADSGWAVESHPVGAKES
jgi:hypothetical protein